MRDEFEILRGEIAKIKQLRHMSCRDIAEAAGLTESTVRAFMCGARGTERTATAISKALGIQRV